jgi:hypothetical protein
VFAPVRLIRGSWPSWLERRAGRLFRDDPRWLIRDDVTPERFRELMSILHVGDTIKITGGDRHPEADELLLSNVDLAGKTILDIGASDGSTSLDLLARVPAFGAYIIADLFVAVKWQERAGHLFLYTDQGQCILVSGRKLIAWPSLSRVVRLAYWPLLITASRTRSRRRELLLLNPEVQKVMAADPRVTYCIHDVFSVWKGEAVDVIKIANLLRRLYFPDAMITRALRAVHASLDDGGYLLVVDNPRIRGAGARAGLYRRVPGGFVTVAESSNTPEIGDLISELAVSVPADRVPGS